jgi:hypothetical protein
MWNLPDRLKQYHTDAWNQSSITDQKFLDEKDKQIVDVAINKEWTNPRFKLRHFVGDAQITPFAKMRQWLLEIKSREEQLERMEYEMDKLELDIEIERRNSESTDDPLISKKFALEIRKLERELGITKRRMNDYYLERQNLVDLVNELLESEQGKTADGRSLLEVLDTEEEDEYEAEYWTNRMAKQAAMDMIFYGRINGGNMDAICMLPADQQTEVLNLCYNYAVQNQNIQLTLQQRAEDMLKLNGSVGTDSLTLAKSVEDDQEGSLNVHSVRDATGE